MVSPLVAYIILPVFVFLFFFLFFKNQNRKKQHLPFPPGPRGLPILGNLHQIDHPNFHHQLWQLSKKYGPLFSIKVGLRSTIVLCSPKVAKETLKDHDLVFCGRPKLLGLQTMSYNGSDMAFSQYNDNWREIRKICVAHVLSAMRVSSFSSIRQFEVKQFIQKISRHASSSKVTNLSEVLMSLTSTMICRSAFGRRYEDDDGDHDHDHKGVDHRSRFHDLLNNCQAMFTTFFVSDYIPFLGWIDRLNGKRARLHKTFNDLDMFYQEVIDEHMDPNRKIPEREDLIDVLLQLKKERSFSIDLTFDRIKAVFMDILTGGTDGTAATIVWAMTELIRNPRVMEKVQEEIRSMFGKKDFVDEDDIEKLPYFKAVMKETLRLHPAVVMIQRETNEDCVIDGYHIPAKTLVYVNLWAIQRDPDAWKDPEEFYPERFLDNAIDFRGQDFELMPFGAGRRICPGMHMGVVTLDIILANLLHSFDWKLPKGVKKEDLDNEVLPGISQHKKNPLCLVAKRQI